MNIHVWPIEKLVDYPRKINQSGILAAPVKTFLGKHWDRMEEAHAAEYRRLYPNLVALAKLVNKSFELPPMSTSGQEWDRVAQWWPFCVLRETAREEDREGCKRLLHFFLLELGVRLPKGVLTPFRLKRGRPKETEVIYQAWIAQGRPRLTSRVCDELAQRFYGPEFARAKSYTAIRTRLRTRVKATILRHEVAATKFERIS
jgi:hypothetical protein